MDRHPMYCIVPLPIHVNAHIDEYPHPSHVKSLRGRVSLAIQG